ncbi:hypothetical protein C8J56DRAFT_950136 [Mycena floridula]|nr:hypothetical protein C8J56DRAFT_950136 [Mycena floridula]
MINDTTAVGPFPELPVELVFLIIQTLLEIEPERALDLVSLSRQIQPIAEAAIYRCIVLDPRQKAEAFHDTIKSGYRPASFYRCHVKTLCSIYSFEVHELLRLFSACSRVQTLGIFNWEDEKSMTGGLDASLDALASSGPQPSKLSCDLRWTLHAEGHPEVHRFQTPLFQNLTHFELYSYDNFLGFDGKLLHLLKNLTHICLAMFPGLLAVPKLFSDLYLADTILVCILHFGDNLAVHDTRTVIDEILDIRSKEPRVVLSCSPSGLVDNLEARPKNILWRDILDEDHFSRQWGYHDWKLEEGEMDMWEEAEAIVKVQRALQAAG